MAKFNFSKVRNPKEELFVAVTEGLEPITFKLSPFESSLAFDCQRWVSALRKNSDVADEIQFSIGASRIIGWSDVKDEDGNLVDFGNGYPLFVRLPEAIPYLMLVGKKTLEDAGVISEAADVEKKQEEVSDSSLQTQS